MARTIDRTGVQTRTFFERWLPHPLLTAVLILLWIALENSVSPANLFAALLLGLTIPIYTSHFWPQRPTIRNPHKVIIFILVLMWDVVVANMHVAYLILFKPAAQLRSGWVSMPLELRTPEAITALAATITLTPGTVSSDLSADGKSLLIHCLDLDNADALVKQIKHRYEKRLKAIFP